MKSFREFKKQALKDPEVKKEYDLLKPEFEVIKKVIYLRLKKEMTQKELAEKIYTKQPSIARLERGFTNPTLYFLAKVAAAFGKKLVVDFK